MDEILRQGYDKRKESVLKVMTEEYQDPARRRVSEEKDLKGMYNRRHTLYAALNKGPKWKYCRLRYTILKS